MVIFRAYTRFLLQAGLPFSQGYMAQVLQNHAGLARLLAPHLPGGGVLAYEELVRGVQIERIGQAELSDAVAEATA